MSLIAYARTAAAWLSIFTFALSTAFPTTAHALPGQVLGQTKISDTAGGLVSPLDNGDLFGSSSAAVGDLDGDGRQEIAVGAPDDDDGGSSRGAVYVLFLDGSGAVTAETKISSTSGGFGGTLANGDAFGTSVAGLGDVDGDNIPDIAVGEPKDADGGAGRGAVWILFLNANGTVKGQAKISDTAGNFNGTLDNGDNFGTSLAGLRDLDGDNVPDLAVGAPFDDDGGADRGAVWILFLAASGSVQSDAKISSTTPGFVGALSNVALFGTAAARMADLDGDTVPELAVGAANDPDGGAGRGAVYVLFLTSAGGVTAFQKISDNFGNFTATLDDFDMFGTSAVEIRDLNGDGVNELFVGTPGDDNGGPNRGAVYVLFMQTDGTVSFFRKISSTTGTFPGPLLDNDGFGSAVAAPRDVDGDGVADLVAGAKRDDDGGSDRGAVWVLLLDGVPGAFCGDGILDSGEACDDGNNSAGDCCSPTCTFDSNGTSCANDDVCDGAETCDGAGTCTPGLPLDCDDGDLCTQDLCDPVGGCMSSSGPASVCLNAAKVQVDFIDKPDDSRDRLKWKWQKGDETLVADMGDPTSTTEYALCVYDGESGSPAFSTQLEVPPSLNWQNKGAKGFKYKDKNLIADGVKQIQLKPGSAGKAKIKFQAQGLNLPMPLPAGLTFFEQDPSVTVQLLNSLGLCWTSEFLPPAKKNVDDRFKDKEP